MKSRIWVILSSRPGRDRKTLSPVFEGVRIVRPGRGRSDRVGTDAEHCCRMVDPSYRTWSFASTTHVVWITVCASKNSTAKKINVYVHQKVMNHPSAQKWFSWIDRAEIQWSEIIQLLPTFWLVSRHRVSLVRSTDGVISLLIWERWSFFAEIIIPNSRRKVLIFREGNDRFRS
jgi:hypothetical protein